MDAGSENTRVDGNAVGGLLAEVFPFEMTTAQLSCAGCPATAPVGALLVYATAMGTIVRCPSCDTALIRITQVRGEYWLDLRGVRVLRLSPRA